MNRTRVPIKKGPGSLRVIKGEREALEREWFWLAVLDGDPVRKEVLIRRLRPCANDVVRVATAVESAQPTLPSAPQ